jgi:hypothetical protein
LGLLALLEFEPDIMGALPLSPFGGAVVESVDVADLLQPVTTKRLISTM